MKNFRSFLKDKKAVKHFLIGVIAGVLLTVFLLCGVKIGVEIYKAYMRSYYAKTAALYSNQNNNIPENIDSVSADYDDNIVTLPTEYLPFECSKNDYVNYSKEANTIFRTVELFDEKFSPCGYIKDALYLGYIDKLYRVVVDENGAFDTDSFSLVIDKNAVPIFVEENKMYLKVNKDYYVLLNTLTGEYEQTDDVNQSVSDVPKGLISKNEAEKIALSAINDKKRFPDVALDENMILFCSVEDDGLYGNPEYYDTHLIHRPDFSGYHNYNCCYFDEFPEYCWKVELVADIPDWWMPKATVFVNAKTGDVSAARVIFPD